MAIEPQRFRRARFTRVAGAGLVAAGVFGVLTLAASDWWNLRHHWGTYPAVDVFYGVISAGIISFGILVSRLELTVDSTRVTVRGVLGTHRIPWPDIECFAFQRSNVVR